MTVSQISGELSLTPQAIYHHIRKMKRIGLVDVSREVRVGHFIETYYRSAAEIFQFSFGEGKAICASEEHIREAMAGLQRLGLIPSVPGKDELRRVMEIMDRTARAKGGNKWLERIAAMDEADLLVKESMMDFAELLYQTDDQLEEQLKMRRELRCLLRDCSKAKKGRSKD
jgi:DNA-binding transcriptional ArsR family regulator